jgi:hypothetical protein
MLAIDGGFVAMLLVHEAAVVIIPVLPGVTDSYAVVLVRVALAVLLIVRLIPHAY